MLRLRWSLLIFTSLSSLLLVIFVPEKAKFILVMEFSSAVRLVRLFLDMTGLLWRMTNPDAFALAMISDPRHGDVDSDLWPRPATAVLPLYDDTRGDEDAVRGEVPRAPALAAAIRGDVRDPGLVTGTFGVLLGDADAVVRRGENEGLAVRGDDTSLACAAWIAAAAPSRGNAENERRGTCDGTGNSSGLDFEFIYRVPFREPESTVSERSKSTGNGIGAGAWTRRRGDTVSAGGGEEGGGE
mmetsp:Transcript_349/g.406  ORF Transcript_349/g.406 Transcript_349/m.406 type:complete len:242 (-) Transcript_349:82-807(-)